MAHKILIVEDDTNLRDTLRYNLQKENYTVVTAVDGAQGLEIARKEKPDLIILDVMLPELNGFEVCRILRKETLMPVLMLTAKTDETDKVVGLELGADDYVTKPFSMRELTARVHAMLRRTQATDITTDNAKLIRFGDFEIHQGRHQVLHRGAVVALTPKEYNLLVFLSSNRGLVFSREKLLEKVWGYEYAGDSRTVDVHIRWLRQKIEPYPSHPRYLITVRGAGYKLAG